MEVCRNRASCTTDPVSGLLTRKAFFEAAEQSLRQCYRRGEPITIAVLAAEGLRALDDGGQWTQVNTLITRVGDLLTSRCRANDCFARFDESRFIAFFERVDSELAMLIAEELVAKLRSLTDSLRIGANAVDFRCGLAGSGTRSPELKALVARATEQCHRARLLSVPVCSDVGTRGGGEPARAETTAIAPEASGSGTRVE
jgi:GGDEF domain-containing protein